MYLSIIGGLRLVLNSLGFRYGDGAAGRCILFLLRGREGPTVVYGVSLSWRPCVLNGA
jgi:hypothetical protein